MSDAVPSGPWMSSEEAAEYLGVDATTLRAWRLSGRYALPFYRIGTRAVRYRKEDLDAWMAKRVHRPAEVEA